MLWPTRIRHLFREVLLGTLAAALALAPLPVRAEPPLPAASPAPPSREPSAMERLDARLASALVNAQYFGAPGLQKAPPTASEVQALRAEFQKIRSGIESTAAELMKTTDPDELENYVSQVVLVAAIYFKMALRLETLRALTGDAVNPNSWDDIYSLRLPLQNLGDFALAQALAEVNRSFGRDEAIFTSTLDMSQGVVRLSLRIREARNIEETRIASDPRRASVETLAQYLAADALLFNRLNLRWRRNRTEPIAIPATLTEKFPALKYKELEYAEVMSNLARLQVRAMLETALPDFLTQINGQGLTLSQPSLVKKLLEAMGREEAKDAEVINKLTTALLELEAKNGTLASLNLMGLLDVTTLDAEQLSRALALALTQAKAMVLRNEFLRSKSSELSPAQLDALRLVIAESAKALHPRILEASRSLAASVVARYRKSQEDARRRADEVFVQSARDYLAIGKSEETPVDPRALAVALASELNESGLSPAAKSQFARVMTKPNYLEARSEYEKLLLQFLPGFKAADGKELKLAPDASLSLEETRQFVQESRWQDDVWQKAGASRPTLLKLNADAADWAKKDVLAWLKSGDIVGFFKYKTAAPNVKDLNLTKLQKKAYFNELRLMMEQDFPLFALKVEGPNGKGKLVDQFESRRHLEINYFDLEFGVGAPGVSLAEQVDQAPDPQAILADAWERTDKILETNLKKVAGEDVSLWESAQRKLGLKSKTDLSEDFLLVLSQSIMLASQIGAHPELASTYANVLTDLAQASPYRRAWDQLVKVNGHIMMTMLVWLGVKWLIKFPAPRIGDFLSWLESSALAPAFGIALNRLNWILLAVFGASIVDKGLNAFYLAPQKRDQLADFTTCSLNGPCVVDSRSLKAWADNVNTQQMLWFLDVGFMAAFIFGIWGASRLLTVTLPQWRLNRLTETLTAKMQDIGFQNGRYSFHPNDLRDMSESTIATLDKRVHPAFDPYREVPEKFKALESRPGSPRPPLVQSLTSLAKANIAARIRATVPEIMNFVRSQELAWQNARLRMRSHLALFNADARFPSPEEMTLFRKRIDSLAKDKKISYEVEVYMRDSLRKVAEFVAPHYIRAQTDPIYASLLKAILGGNRDVAMSADDATSLMRYGAGYMTIYRGSSTIAHDHQLVPFGTRAEDIAHYADVQLARRAATYRIRNEAWLAYLRQFINPKDLFPDNGPRLIKGPRSQLLIEQRVVPLLEDFRGVPR